MCWVHPCVFIAIGCTHCSGISMPASPSTYARITSRVDSMLRVQIRALFSFVIRDTPNALSACLDMSSPPASRTTGCPSFPLCNNLVATLATFLSSEMSAMVDSSSASSRISRSGLALSAVLKTSSIAAPSTLLYHFGINGC